MNNNIESDKTIMGKMETLKHIHEVRRLLFGMMEHLDKRARMHDLSKLESPEKEIFGEYTPELAKCEYMSKEYKELMEKVRPAIEHHYKKNRHHTGYFESQEIWKDIVNYEGYYQISSQGRVKKLARTIEREKMGNFICQEKIYDASITPKGYYRIQLSKDGEKKNHMVHRLVAEAFVPNTDSKPFVNHKNSCRYDNNFENLEWVTPQENLQHAYDEGLKIGNAKYIVICEELDIVTVGVNKMAFELRKRGYEKAEVGLIYNCINRENNTWSDLSFISYPLEDFNQISYIDKMDLIDILEMLCDWFAASKRNLNGDITSSINKNAERFGISPQLTKILHNTAIYFQSENQTV